MLTLNDFLKDLQASTLPSVKTLLKQRYQCYIDYEANFEKLHHAFLIGDKITLRKCQAIENKLWRKSIKLNDRLGLRSDVKESQKANCQCVQCNNLFFNAPGPDHGKLLCQDCIYLNSKLRIRNKGQITQINFK